jgi:hypothetical protein
MDEILDSDDFINHSVGIYLLEISKRISCSHLTCHKCIVLYTVLLVQWLHYCV